MASDRPRCAVCPERDDLVGLVVAGEQLHLCVHHRAELGDHRPESFDDLASFFAALGGDRRSGRDRRSRERRVFPPRPEGRRRGMGRRAGDPKDL